MGLDGPLDRVLRPADSARELQCVNGKVHAYRSDSGNQTFRENAL
jgi:hypothetical protein